MIQAAEAIQVRGARLHNLKNLDIDLPWNRWTTVSGVSGSGKSSLAFDTIYAEGQRRYLESLSAYARQFLERMEKPEVDAIDGIAPAVAIRQKNSSRNPRSTVATATEVHDYLRVLYARAGDTVCPDCHAPVGRDHVDAAVLQLLRDYPGRRALALFAAGSGDALRARLPELRAKGFDRLYQDGRIFLFSQPESLLDLDFERPVHVLVDRLAIGPEERSRIVEAIETAYREAGEIEFELPAEDGQPAARRRFNERLECKTCGRRFEDPEPRLFSFNNPFGACPRCQGFGNTTDFDEARVVPNPALSLAEGAVDPMTKPRARKWFQSMKRYAVAAGVPLDVPWQQLTPAQRAWVWEGDAKFTGVTGMFARLERKKYKVHVRVFLARYRGYARCPDCHGARLRPEALWVQLRSGGAWRNLAEVLAMSVDEAREFFDRLELSAERRQVSERLLLEVRRRLDFLVRVGLQYLTLDRLAATLSGGEAQRIQLATCLGAQLTGSLYVLDEPSIGLHPRDTERLIATLRALCELGNTLLVVEHDPELIRAADYVVELGPGAGELGGRLVAAGTPAEIAAHPDSPTGRFLRDGLPPVAARRPPGREWLRLEGATAHNLHGLDVAIPLRRLVAITGVSGSGKSTLIHEILYPNLRAAVHAAESGAPPPEPIGCRRLVGAGAVTAVVMVDQSPIGRTPRSNPVTYLKAFDAIRNLLAQQPEARKLGLRAGAFSFNVAGGRCEACQGEGVVTVDMQFLADVTLVCEECGGTRFQNRVLEVRYRNHNVHEILQLTVQEALRLFRDQSAVTRPLTVLEEIGLGYLRLGQSATTLSGGEAQRLKLAFHLSQPRAAEGAVFLLDEPTTGLHAQDIVKLLEALRRLLAAGGSVVVIEHNLEVMRAADWMIDLGPEGGGAGGRLVAAGTPEEIATTAGSHTGRYLAKAASRE